MPFGGHQQICRSKLWFINPHYKQKFHLTPRLLPHWVWRVKYIRNFFTTSCWYVLGLGNKFYQDTPNIQTAYAVFEKDSKVYGVYGERTKLLLNFSLAVGDKAGQHKLYSLCKI